MSQGYTVAADCQKGGIMTEHKPTVAPSGKRYLTATEVAELLDVSITTAYRIIRKLNAELNAMGKITISGKVSAKYFYENTYL